MKQNIIFFVATMLLSGHVLSQEKDSVKMLAPVTVTPASNVNAEVTKSFNKEFKKALNPKWFTMDKDYLVKFIQDDMSNNAYFKQNGSLVYHISYGYEKDLPLEIRQMINNSYSEYVISRAIHV
ncbi:MAG TPA: hypothetical protein VEV87_02470, partial [Chitinophagaceae bacterium]|nr:hypothetical protein [Chitinophagaceae bacterium]